MWRRGGWREGFGQRFGSYDPKLKQALTNRHVIWLHAVSVGEVNTCTHLIQAMEERLPNAKLVVSTTTSTGMAELRRKLPTHISKIYYPIDRRPWVVRALSTLNPEAIVLVEAEIWPNFLWRARQRGTPVFLVNSRLSDRSFKRYRRFDFLFRPLFRSLKGIGAQSEADRDRLLQLGCRAEAIRTVGSMKFDAAKLNERRRLDLPALLGRIGVGPQRRVLVCGSTHPGEEAVLAEQFLRLRAKFPDLFLILAPRHVERSRQVGRELQQRGIRFVYRNEVMNHTQFTTGELDCLLLNTTGELSHFYEHATVVFIGKSLLAKGGQNPIEPGASGKPVVFGPHMQNFQEVAAQFLKGGAAAQVNTPAELERVLGELLANPARCAEMGRNALAVVEENLGAIERTIEMILEHLDPELYVAPRKAAGH